MTFTADIPSTEAILESVLSSSLPELPPQEQPYASTYISWWETDPGEVYIHAEGGTADDRHYASTLVGLQLQAHGYRRAQFDLDRDVEHLDSRRISSWPDLMNKAKRLIQSGQVHVLRNGYNYIMGHVIGDHGEYDTELSRDDPQGRSITGWQCSCPWDQYAWQRTRKWKKFEGRPCSHVMALYWKALSTPLDEQLTQEQAEAMGTGQKLPPVAPVPEHPPEIEDRMMKGERPPEEGPRVFGPEGPIQGDQMQMDMPPDAMGGPPGPAQAPMTPPPSGPQPPGVLPPFPGEQMEMQWAGPGTTPGGQTSPPGAVSVPGAKPQTFMNPLQQPGTYSKVGGTGEMWLTILRNQYAEGQISLEEYEQKIAQELRYQDAMGREVDWSQVHTAADFNAPEIVRLKNEVMGLAEGPEKGMYGDGEYREVPAGSSGEVLSQDATTGWVEIIVPLDESGYHEPFHVRVFVEPSDIEHTTAIPPGPFIRRKTKVATAPEPIEDPNEEKWDDLYNGWSQNHDFDPRWDYSDELRPEWQQHPLIQAAQQRLDGHTSGGRVFAADFRDRDAVGMYASGTGSDAPAILIDPYQHEYHTQSPEEALDQVLRTVDHEYRHAMQENEAEGASDWADEDDAENWYPG